MSAHIPLSMEHLLQRARREAGYDDFGTHAFLPTFAKMIENVNAILDNLHERGRQGIEDRLVRLLVNRLRMQRDIARHPEILEQEMLPPAAIFGLPRTGSTKLQRMLAAGHGFQETLMWQVYNSAPFPNAVAGQRDPRIQAAVDYLQWMAADAADGLKGHLLISEAAEEEGMLMEQTLETIYTISFVPAYDWVKYIERLDKTDMYLHLRHCLQYLQWQFHRGERKPWLLKYPPNLGNESYISRTFPGVKYVITHRDPFPVLASLSQQTTAVHFLYCKDRDIRRFSRWAFDEFSSEMERHLAWRDANPEVPILDLAFKDIVKNGLETAHRVYTFLGADWTSETEAKINEWLIEDAKAHDRLEYSFDDVDFSEDECRLRFGNYYRRFADFL